MKIYGTAFGVSVLFFCSALVVYLTVNQVVKYGVYQSLIISPQATRYSDWVDIKGDLRLEIWIWNVTNPLEISKNHDTVPHLSQVGPFTYRVNRHKHNINFNKSDQSVSYWEKYSFDFDRSLSVADEFTNLTIFNYPLLSILSKIDILPAMIRKVIIALIYAAEKDETTKTLVVVSRNVHSILFGYTDPFLHALKINIKWLKDINDYVFLLENPIEDYMTVSSGENISFPPETVLSWKNISDVNFYGDRYCNMINGTDGNLFPLPLKRSMYVFLSDLCRSVEIEREGYSGKTLVNYRLSDKTQANYTLNPSNQCFDTLGSAALFSIPCRNDALVVISNPHFLNANPIYTYIGMTPNSMEHLTRLSIDKLTGYPMRVNKRLQINFLSSDKFDFKLFRPSFLYPVLWMNQSYTARYEDTLLLWRRVHIPILACIYTALFFTACGSIFLFIAFIMFMYTYRTKQEGFDDIDESQEPEVLETSPLIHNAF